MNRRSRPTLDEIQRWPATSTVTEGSIALGCSRSHLYELIKAGEAPVRTLRVGGRVMIITASLIEALS